MDMSINQRLANFLYEKKISQEELRIKLGLKTRQQVSNWLNCRDHIPDKHLMGIIKAAYSSGKPALGVGAGTIPGTKCQLAHP